MQGKHPHATGHSALVSAIFYPGRGSRDLTREREAGVLAYIKAHYREHGIGPTVRDLVVIGFLKSNGSMAPLLWRLVERGLLKKGPGLEGRFVPVRQPGEPCPLCGCNG